MKRVNNKSEQQKVSHAWGPAGHLTPHKDILRALRQPTHTHTHTLTHKHTHTHTHTHIHDATNLKTLEKLNHPHFSIMSVPTVRGASCCSIMMIKCINVRGFSLFSLRRQLCLPNDKRLFMILLFSSYMYCLTYVVPYISLTLPWTQHIHLMQWINGGERVSALGPLGTRLDAERTLIPTHPHQIHFLALSSGVVRSLWVKVNCQ